jgi:hypothetical protein
VFVPTGAGTGKTVRTREVTILGHLDDGETGVVVVDSVVTFRIERRVGLELFCPLPVVERLPHLSFELAVVGTGTREIDRPIARYVVPGHPFETLGAETGCGLELNRFIGHVAHIGILPLETVAVCVSCLHNQKCETWLLPELVSHALVS